MMLMRYANISFPILLDDLAQHVQNAYGDGGGLAKVVIIDRNGLVVLNNKWQKLSDYIEAGGLRYQQINKSHCALAVTLKTLIEDGGVWNGKEPTVPDWQPPPSIENAPITAVDLANGSLSLKGADGKALTLQVDALTRIISSGAMDAPLALKDLRVGTPVSCIYAAMAPSAGASSGMNAASLILVGDSLANYLTNPFGVADKPWCPAIVRAVEGTTISATLVPRPRASLLGMTYWAQANAMSPTWMAQVVKGWLDHPDQVLHFQVDRATEVFVNGMQGTVADIRPGDHLGVEFRPEQSADHLRPYFIFVYRYGSPALPH